MATVHAQGGRELRNDLEPLEIPFSPLGLELDHRFQRLDGEGVTPTVGRDRDHPAIGVPVALVRPPLAYEKNPSRFSAAINSRAVSERNAA